MTERENTMAVIERTGKAEWIPIMDDCMLFLVSSADGDHPHPPNNGTDWFGCTWVYDPKLGGYMQVTGEEHPYLIQDITKWEEVVNWPDLEEVDWESAAEKDLKDFDRQNKILFLKTECGTFERLHMLYGFENAFMAMVEEPEAFCSLMEAISDFRIKFYKKLIQYYKPDVILLMDDVGSQNGPLLSVDMYRKFIKPYDKKIIAYLHSKGVKAALHSCGCMECFIDDMIDMGADIIHPLQGDVNDREMVEQKFGDKVCFFGALDNLVHHTSSSAKTMREEVHRLMDIFAQKKNLIALPKSYVEGMSPVLLDETRKMNYELFGHIN